MITQPTASAPTQRVVRVFISSTFRDMQEERDILVKRVFPELRRRCRERGVEFVEVDLRWGVTEEQTERGEALPICLAEIDNCRPYFVGLLGERYGWVPNHITEELLETQPWLAEHPEHSVTALEILHGVLNHPQMTPRAFFYYEPFPRPMNVQELNRTYSYSRPDEVDYEYVRCQPGRHYADGSTGSILIHSDGSFACSLGFKRGRPGLYTICLWLKDSKGEGIPATFLTVRVKG